MEMWELHLETRGHWCEWDSSCLPGKQEAEQLFNCSQEGPSMGTTDFLTAMAWLVPEMANFNHSVDEYPNLLHFQGAMLSELVLGGSSEVRAPESSSISALYLQLETSIQQPSMTTTPQWGLLDLLNKNIGHQVTFEFQINNRYFFLVCAIYRTFRIYLY